MIPQISHLRSLKNATHKRDIGIKADFVVQKYEKKEIMQIILSTFEVQKNELCKN